MFAFRHEEEVLEPILGWNFPPEHQELVHPHWRNFVAPSKYWHFGLALIYLMLMTMSFLGNGIVIWIFSTCVQRFARSKYQFVMNCRSKSLRTASNMFIINLAIFDLLMMLEMPMFIVNSFNQRLLGYEIGCDIYAVLGSLSGIGGAITNAVIAFDRYK
jgi:r-opsin